MSTWGALQVQDAIAARNLDAGFRIPGLIRFIGQEKALLSNANDAPRMFINIEDHLTHQTGIENIQFQVYSYASTVPGPTNWYDS